ncbi:MAG: ABC transporter permease subunit [Acidobacteria bacterium]|nr:MAG: ABC transporter permease subunit [Acidobacteriota bacterium]
MTTPASFTGRARARTTKKSVRVVDAVARSLISIGGIATIVAVMGVFVFLVWVVAPLFLPAEIGELRTFDLDFEEAPIHLALDEYRVLGWALLPAGRIEVFRLDSGARRASRRLAPPGQLRSAHLPAVGKEAVLGLADGRVQLAEIGFVSTVLSSGKLPEALRRELDAAPAGVPIDYRDGVLQRIAGDQYRSQELAVNLGEALSVAPGPVVAVARVTIGAGPRIAALVDVTPRAETTPDAPAGGGLKLFLIDGEEESNFLTGETTLSFGAPRELPFRPIGEGVPIFLGISGTGADVYVAWADGSLLRLDVSSPADAFIAEHGRLLPPGVGLTAIGFVLGNNTLVWGGADGRLEAGFTIRVADYRGDPMPGLERDRRATTLLVRTKSLAEGRAAPRSVAASARTRLILSGFDDGEIRLFNVTHEAQLARRALAAGEPVLALAMAPKEDALAAVTGGRVHVASLDPRYSEASWNALFRPTWYEGYPEPIHSWQSSSGSDDFEPKHSLMPLIFGTIKATFYSMLFGAPLALLAAIFTSEFLDARTRAVIKPTIELMASLPSVVLGFLAALVFAPFVENVVPATLASFVTFPLAFLLGAQLWQLLPSSLAVRLERWRFGFLLLALPLGVALAALLGPRVEGWVFAGDLKAWLAWEPGGDPRFASALGGWLFLTLPLAAAAAWLVLERLANPWLRQHGDRWDRRRLAVADLVKQGLGVGLALGLAVACAVALDALGFDPRGGFLDTYEQRNALVVGFVMGFAIIPIIYTISEDALRAVPEHLRSASLGAGATPWQTAVRIVVPTAMSGLFSALMIGLGRAVGETMIVLMAAGNTPVMSWNVFEGFRTLSANIAVELPEAVQGSTHYRTLFLAALVLFAMTFVVNTIAEVVRLRFRQRAYQL